MIKSKNEIELIKASAKWGDRVHELLQKYTVPGVSEIQVSMRASMEATREMIEILGDKYVAMGGRGVSAGYRGQIGPHSALPHSQTINAIFKPGDTLVTGAGGDLGGYHSELERTMFVGKPSDEQIKYFDLMYEAQQIAFDNIKPGEPYGVVDEAVRSFFDKNDLWEYWRHHQGHNIGLEGHEAPFFDIGDDSIMKPGMVVSVEPGIYVPGLGGFRHSDTGVITNDGFEIITHYPRELKDLICG
jgi:Xaa-Pro aminopeptidase